MMRRTEALAEDRHQREDFHTVIVAYFPGRDLPGRIDKILSQFEKVVIVDNASAGESLAMIEDPCEKQSR